MVFEIPGRMLSNIPWQVLDEIRYRNGYRGQDQNDEQTDRQTRQMKEVKQLRQQGRSGEKNMGEKVKRQGQEGYQAGADVEEKRNDK